MMRYFHGSTARLKPGDVLRPGREVGRWANWTMREEFLERGLRSGRTVHPAEVVWLAPSREAALNWASHSLLKCTPKEIRDVGGMGVYEVEPVGLDFPLEPHEAGEACCASARVLSAEWEDFPQDLCDGCGEQAEVWLGAELQLCHACADAMDAAPLVAAPELL